MFICTKFGMYFQVWDKLNSKISDLKSRADFPNLGRQLSKRWLEKQRMLCVFHVHCYVLCTVSLCSALRERSMWATWHKAPKPWRSYCQWIYKLFLTQRTLPLWAPSPGSLGFIWLGCCFSSDSKLDLREGHWGCSPRLSPSHSHSCHLLLIQQAQDHGSFASLPPSEETQVQSLRLNQKVYEGHHSLHTLKGNEWCFRPALRELDAFLPPKMQVVTIPTYSGHCPGLPWGIFWGTRLLVLKPDHSSSLLIDSWGTQVISSVTLAISCFDVSRSFRQWAPWWQRWNLSILFSSKTHKLAAQWLLWMNEYMNMYLTYLLPDSATRHREGSEPFLSLH